MTGCWGIQFFDSPPFSQHSQLGYLWLPTPYSAALVWVTGSVAPKLLNCRVNITHFVKSHEILLDYFEENKGQICLEYLPPLGNLVAYQFYNEIVVQDKILKWTFNEYLKKSRKNRSSNEIQFKWTFMTAWKTLNLLYLINNFNCI